MSPAVDTMWDDLESQAEWDSLGQRAREQVCAVLAVAQSGRIHPGWTVVQVRDTISVELTIDGRGLVVHGSKGRDGRNVTWGRIAASSSTSR